MTDKDKNEREKPFSSSDPDLNQGEFQSSDDFDEPETPRRPPVNNRTRYSSSNSFSRNLGGLLGGLTDLISDLAYRTEQTQQSTRENSESEGKTGEFRFGGEDKTYVVKWGFNASNLSERGTSPFSVQVGTIPSTPSNPTPRPSDPANAEMMASIREPLTEIHDEAKEGQVLVIVELPGVDESKIQLEILGDVLIIHGEGSNFSYEKECLLPAIVQPEPLSRNYHNGVLELRLKKQ